METLLSNVTPIADQLGLPVSLVGLLTLLVCGVIAHWLIRRLVARLGVFADTTDTRWDDVLYYSISPPAEYAMWVCLIYLSLGLFEGAESLQANLL